MSKVDMRDAFFERLVEVARKDERVIVLSADHGAFALEKFQEEMPDRYINMGIAEQNMVGVAAGLAASGKIVFIYGITPFVSLRVLEQLTLDVSAMQLPVNVISVGAGFTYSTDGPTHQGLQDVAAIATIPGMTILNSSDPINTRAFVDIAMKTEKPHYIRIEKEKLNSFSRLNKDFLEKGFSLLTPTSAKHCVISSGLSTQESLQAVTRINHTNDLKICLIDLHDLSTFDKAKLFEVILNFENIITIEEGYKNGASQIISTFLCEKGFKGRVLTLAIPTSFIFENGTRDELKSRFELSSDKIFKLLSEKLCV
jgi:transketolase